MLNATAMVKSFHVLLDDKMVVTQKNFRRSREGAKKGAVIEVQN